MRRRPSTPTSRRSRPARAPRCATSSAACSRRRCARDRGRRYDGGRVQCDPDPAHAGRDHARPGAALHADGLLADPHRPRLHPHRPRHADGAAEPGARRHRAVPDALGDAADVRPDQEGRLGPAAEAQDHAGPGARRRAGPDARVHVPPDAEQGHRAVRRHGEAEAPEDARRHPDLRADPRVRDQRAQDGVPDRLPDLPAIPGDRPRRLLDADVDGHGDAAARLHLAALQDPSVRPGGRLEPRHPIARGELPLMNQDVVVSLTMDAISVAMKVALPMLMAGLGVGLVVSVFQAVTQIQEQTLAFIPKVVALVAIMVLFGPWMLGQIETYTTALWASIPQMVGP